MYCNAEQFSQNVIPAIMNLLIFTKLITSFE